MSDNDPLDFTGKVVLVTGGGRGVGRGITETFLRAGADVVVCGRTTPESLPAAGERQAVFVEADVRDADQVDALFAT
ncbi:SDR family NAD(P)-dependent oxidoreductase, partial [Salmonella sp. SAL4360]|uniref:SDR family NAD(P)-dependent oxidoreductase n=1 Tax=Salmonella sp. SAL4360 TaxID=3159881 RepID=UPI003978A9D1